jgi:hypothetical protein
MLFDFYQEMPVSFWMKNTLIPLDMVFIAADGTVRHVHANAVPLSTDTVPSSFPGARGARDQRRQRRRCSGSSRATRSSTRSSATP